MGLSPPPAYESTSEAASRSGSIGCVWVQAKVSQTRVKLCVVEIVLPTHSTQPPEGSAAVDNFDADSKRVRSVERSRAIVVQGLQLLFHCEYLILVEYVECIIPLVFVIYRSVRTCLPNIVYYPSGEANFGWIAVANVLVFAAMEVFSLLLFEAFTRRTFSYSPLYQLAFALETQMHLFQGSLWLIILGQLQFELLHSGTWIRYLFSLYKYRRNDPLVRFPPCRS
jgi:hypothetical protein